MRIPAGLYEGFYMSLPQAGVVPPRGLSRNLTKVSRGGGCKVTRGSVRHRRLLCDPGSGRLCLHPRVTPFLSVSPVRLLRLCTAEETKGPGAEATVERSPQFFGVEIPCKGDSDSKPGRWESIFKHR